MNLNKWHGFLLFMFLCFNVFSKKTICHFLMYSQGCWFADGSDLTGALHDL